VNAPVDSAPSLRTACNAAIPDLHRYCRDPWTLIGSAAAWLTGAEVVVADIDVLTTDRDAMTMRERWHSRVNSGFMPADANRFRSNFARYDFAGIPVEVMGGLEVAGAEGWKLVQVGDIISVNFLGLTIYIPSIVEQVRILNLFGRPKDLQRSTLLKSSSGYPQC